MTHLREFDEDLWQCGQCGFFAFQDGAVAAFKISRIDVFYLRQVTASARTGSDVGFLGRDRDRSANA